MALTVYSMGDMHIFTGVLNAVAMTFNSSIFDLTQGAGVVVVGMLLGMIFIVMPVLAGQRLNFTPFIFSLVLLFGGITPKERLQVEDVFTGQVTAVDNVPLIVALPASLVASLSKSLSNVIETTFSTTGGSYLPMGAEGFVNPLKLLLSFRDPDVVRRAYPFFSANLHEFTRYCAGTDPAFNAAALATSGDMVAYLASLQVRGIMTYATAAQPAGVAFSCTEGQQRLVAEAGALASDAGTTRLLRSQTAGNYSIGQTGAGATMAGFTDAYNGVTAGIMGNMQSAQQFMVNSIARTPITQGYNCMNRPTGPESSNCAAMIVERQAMEQGNVDAAAQASIFTKTVMPAMNILLALFFAFSPIVLAVALMSGPHGIRIVAGFLMFGAWTQSWLPIAAVINYIIQMQTQSAFSNFSAGGITMENFVQFYNVLTMKIGLASELMAMVPVISMALMSGSMMALTSVSNRIGQKDHVDEKMLAPSFGSNSAIAENGAWVGQPTRQNLSSLDGRGTGWQVTKSGSGFSPFGEVNIAAAAEKSYRHAVAHHSAQSQRTSQTVSEVLDRSITKDNATQWAENINKASRATSQEAAKFAHSVGQKIATGKGLTGSDEEILDAALGLKLAGNGVGAKKMLATMRNQSVSMEDLENGLRSDEQSRAHAEESMRSFGKNLTTTASTLLSKSDKDAISKDVAKSDEAREALDRATARTRSVGLSTKAGLQELGGNVNSRLIGGEIEAQGMIESEVRKEDWNAYQAEYSRILRNAERVLGKTAVTDGERTAARLQALQAVNGDGFLTVLQKTGQAGMTAAVVPAGENVEAKNAHLTAQAEAIDTKGLEAAGKAAHKAEGLQENKGANVKKVEGFVKSSVAEIEAAIRDAAKGTLGKGAINQKTGDFKKMAEQIYQQQVYLSNLANEHGDPAGMRNVAEFARQWGNFEEEHPVAAFAITMLPLGRAIAAARGAGKAVEAVRGADAAVNAAKAGGNARAITKAEATLAAAERTQARAMQDFSKAGGRQAAAGFASAGATAADKIPDPNERNH